MSDDPFLQSCRAELAALDQAILAALNQRLALVRRLRAHKAALGLDLHDPAQEARLLAQLAGTNPGPLSEAELRAIFGFILEVGKREAIRPE